MIIKKTLPNKFNISLIFVSFILTLLVFLILLYPLIIVKIWNIFYFYFLPANIIFLAMFVYLAKEPIHSLFCLIGVFIHIILLFLSFKVEFLSLLLLIIYVGAVAILFLFVIMMFNLSEHLSQENTILGWEGHERAYSIIFIVAFYAHFFVEVLMKPWVKNQNENKEILNVNFPKNNFNYKYNDYIKSLLTKRFNDRNSFVKEVKHLDYAQQCIRLLHVEHAQAYQEAFFYPLPWKYSFINKAENPAEKLSFSINEQIIQVVWEDIEPSYKKNMIYNISNEFNDVSLFSNFLYMHNSYLFLLSSLILLTSMLVALALTTSAKIKNIDECYLFIIL